MVCLGEEKVEEEREKLSCKYEKWRVSVHVCCVWECSVAIHQDTSCSLCIVHKYRKLYGLHIIWPQTAKSLCTQMLAMVIVFNRVKIFTVSTHVCKCLDFVSLMLGNENQVHNQFFWNVFLLRTGHFVLLFLFQFLMPIRFDVGKWPLSIVLSIRNTYYRVTMLH